MPNKDAVRLAIEGTNKYLIHEDVTIDEFGGLPLRVHQRNAAGRNQVIRFIQKSQDISKSDQIAFNTLMLSTFVTDIDDNPFVGMNDTQLVGSLADEGITKLVEAAMRLNRLSEEDGVDDLEKN